MSDATKATPSGPTMQSRRGRPCVICWPSKPVAGRVGGTSWPLRQARKPDHPRHRADHPGDRDRARADHRHAGQLWNRREADYREAMLRAKQRTLPKPTRHG